MRAPLEPRAAGLERAFRGKREPHDSAELGQQVDGRGPCSLGDVDRGRRPGRVAEARLRLEERELDGRRQQRFGQFARAGERAGQHRCGLFGALPPDQDLCARHGQSRGRSTRFPWVILASTIRAVARIRVGFGQVAARQAQLGQSVGDAGLGRPRRRGHPRGALEEVSGVPEPSARQLHVREIRQRRAHDGRMPRFRRLAQRRPRLIPRRIEIRQGEGDAGGVDGGECLKLAVLAAGHQRSTDADVLRCVTEEASLRFDPGDEEVKGARGSRVTEARDIATNNRQEGYCCFKSGTVR